MFGFQRTGDQMWAFGDARGRGFLMGATAGRTTLTGEGLQHDDGHTQILASTVPNLRAYDPAFAYELAAVVRDGIERMYGAKPEDVFYYITLYNENYAQPVRPEGLTDEAILRGVYRFAAAPDLGRDAHPARLVGSGSILQQVLAARDLLAEKFGVAAEVYSAPSFPLLRRDALEAERWNRLHPDAKTPRVPYVATILPRGRADRRRDRLDEGAARHGLALAAAAVRWRSARTGSGGATRARTCGRCSRSIRPTSPRRRWSALARCGALPASKAAKAIRELGIDPDKTDPLAL